MYLQLLQTSTKSSHKTKPAGRPKLDISGSYEKVYEYMESCDEKSYTPKMVFSIPFSCTYCQLHFILVI